MEVLTNLNSKVLWSIRNQTINNKTLKKILLILNFNNLSLTIIQTNRGPNPALRLRINLSRKEVKNKTKASIIIITGILTVSHLRINRHSTSKLPKKNTQLKDNQHLIPSSEKPLLKTFILNQRLPTGKVKFASNQKEFTISLFMKNR